MDISSPHRVRWVVPAFNPRRASLRYRCIYPAQELLNRGRDVGIWQSGDSVDASLTLVFDAWTLFTTTNSLATAQNLVDLAKTARQKGACIVLDNCDNQFAAITQSTDWSRGLELLQELGHVAHVIVTCSQSLCEAMQANIGGTARHVVIDDPIEEKIRFPDETFLTTFLSIRQKLAWLRVMNLRYQLARDRLTGHTPLVWFGSHGNQFSPGGMNDILPLRPIFERVAKSNPISLTIISNQRKKFDLGFKNWNFPTHYLEWDRVNFLAALKMHEISIIPSVDNAFTRCKSSNRLTLSIYHGLSVVADPIPSYESYRDIARIGNWENNLQSLLNNVTNRRENLILHKAIVCERNSISKVTDHWENLFFHC